MVPATAADHHLLAARERPPGVAGADRPPHARHRVLTEVAVDHAKLLAAVSQGDESGHRVAVHQPLDHERSRTQRGLHRLGRRGRLGDLERHRQPLGPALGLVAQARSPQRRRHLLGDRLHEQPVGLVEAVGLRPADVQHSHHLTVDRDRRGQPGTPRGARHQAGHGCRIGDVAERHLAGARERDASGALVARPNHATVVGAVAVERGHDHLALVVERHAGLDRGVVDAVEHRAHERLQHGLGAVDGRHCACRLQRHGQPLGA